MTDSFLSNVKRERLDLHAKVLNANGYDLDDSIRGGKRPLHDLYCRRTDSWFECKSDYSGFNERLLVEVFANVRSPQIDTVPFNRPIPYADLLPILAFLPAHCDALATDQNNREQRHLLSYFFSRSAEYVLCDVHEVCARFERGRYDWIVCGDERESWRSICAIVPLSDCRPILTLSPREYVEAIRFGS